MAAYHSKRLPVMPKPVRSRHKSLSHQQASDEGVGQPIAHLLHLQRTIGNAAVKRLLQRDPDEVEHRNSRSGLAPEATANPDEPANDILNATSTSPLVQLLPTLQVNDLRLIYKTLREPPLTGLGDMLPIKAGNLKLDIPVDMVAGLLKQVNTALTDRLKESLHATRQPLVTQMNALEDEAQRREQLLAIRNIDKPILTELRELNVANPSTTPWKHTSSAVQDSLLAALQLAVMLDAEHYLDAPQTAEADSKKPFGMDGDWCGMFAALNYLTEGLDPHMKAAFLHVNNQVDFFTYIYNRNPERIKKWIYAEDQWWNVKDYHEHRSAKRGWIDAKQIFDGGALDIRSGDMVLLDHSGETNPDHIQMVQSYNSITKQLFTIGGNDGGYVVDNNPKHPPADPDSDEGKMEAATGRKLKRGGSGGHVGMSTRDLGQQPDPSKVAKRRAEGKKVVRIFAIGRPSIVDLENHIYHKANSDKPPKEKPTGM